MPFKLLKQNQEELLEEIALLRAQIRQHEKEKRVLVKKNMKMAEGLKLLRRKTTTQAKALLDVVQSWEDMEDSKA